MDLRGAVGLYVGGANGDGAFGSKKLVGERASAIGRSKRPTWVLSRPQERTKQDGCHNAARVWYETQNLTKFPIANNRF
jgi:hypothetical protein